MAEFRVEPVDAECPCCGEPIELLVDCSETEQRYVEDCQVCCRPMNVQVIVDQDGVPNVLLSPEDDG